MRFFKTAVLLVGGGFLIGACGARTNISDLGPATGTGGRPTQSDCCSAHGDAGCEDAEVEACVCEFNPTCCTDSWDGTCALIVPLGGCGTCEIGTGGRASGGGPSTGGNPGVGGLWFTTGGIGAAPSTGGRPSVGGAPAGGAPTTGGVSPAGGDPGTGGMANECCFPGDPGTPGCSDPMVESCVCASDPFCCEQYWDSFCVTGAQNCGACRGGDGGAPGVGGFQGIGGQGIGGQGIGGQGIGGQGIGGQGVGGAFTEVCSSILGGGCGDCLCKTCANEISSCLNDPGCWSIFACAAQTGCTGVDCYQVSTCKAVIDQAAGSLPGALGLIACSNNSGCGCF